MLRFTLATRLTVFALGVLTVLVGLVAWSLETEYGGNPVAGSESTGDGGERVFDLDETRLDNQGQPITTIVFEGTPAEAAEFIRRRHEEGRSYAIPGLVIAVGGIAMVVAILPPWRRSRDPQT